MKCVHESNRKKPTEHICQYCQKPFSTRRNDKIRNKYCSIPCFQAAYHSRSILTCRYCSKQFEVKLSQNNRRYCSPECRKQAGRVTCICQYCEKRFEITRSAFIQSGGKFCSRECHYRWESENVSGENHPLWKGGRVYYRGPNWLAQRKLALERDNRTCQCCGKKKPRRGNHDVHHIVSFRDFGYVVGKNDNYKLANDLRNLITLCKKCHKKAEKGEIFIQPNLL